MRAASEGGRKSGTLPTFPGVPREGERERRGTLSQSCPQELAQLQTQATDMSSGVVHGQQPLPGLQRPHRRGPSRYGDHRTSKAEAELLYQTKVLGAGG